jgi:hypothetical protein
MAFRVDFLTARFCKTLMSDVREVVRTGTVCFRHGFISCKPSPYYYLLWLRR